MGQNSKKKQKVHCKNTYSRKSTFLKGTFFRTKFLRILRLISHCSGSILKFSEKSPFQKSALPGIRVFTMDFFPRKFGEKKIFFPEKSRLQKQVFPEEHFFESDFFPEKKIFFSPKFLGKKSLSKKCSSGNTCFYNRLFSGKFFFSPKFLRTFLKIFSGKKSITKTGIPGRALF